MPLRVRDYMTTSVLTVTRDADVTYAIRLMVEHDISGLPVVDEDGALVGILTERDCIEVALQAGYFDELGGSVADYMSASVETAEPEESLIDVAARLQRSRFRRYPVVQDGRLVGLLSRRDVLRALQHRS